jgi:hypothetical protein
VDGVVLEHVNLKKSHIDKSMTPYDGGYDQKELAMYSRSIKGLERERERKRRAISMV